MIILDYNLSSDKNGGKVTAFNYSHSLNELCGSWSAHVAGGAFLAGNSISFAGVMTNGIISRAQKDSSGLWLIEGYDAGVRLTKSIPAVDELPAFSEGTTTNTRAVIAYLAEFCNIPLSMPNNEGLSGFSVRSLISGSTCAEAVLELAMFSGLIAFIGNDGKLHVQKPTSATAPIFENVLDDSESDFDLDGYATQVTVTLRKSSYNDEQEEETPSETYYTGRTPATSPSRKNLSGSFSNGSYSVTTLEPFGVAEREETTITENDITINTVQTHDYDYKHKIIWRGNQEYVLFAFIETGYTLTKTTTGAYSNGISFSETTTETMTRSLSPFDAIGVPEDWDGQIGMVDTETITRSTVREGAPAPTDDMPAYSPPFDSRITRQYSRELRGKGLLCNETEQRYEARQVGSISPVKLNGEAVPHFLLGSNLAIQTHSTPQWVEVDTYRTYYEQYDDDGNCVLSTRSEYSDDGSKWLTEHALSDTGDETLNEYQKAYAKFSQDSQGLEVSLGSSVLSSAWHFIELQGRMMNFTGDDEEGTVLGNIEDWFSNGEYLSFEICPHYNKSAETCNVFTLADASNGNTCYRRRNQYLWKHCPRAINALKLAREKEDKQIDAPIIGIAALDNEVLRSPSVGYNREIYINETLSDEEAQSIADNIAENILKIKGIKGLRKTVTIPYNPSLAPNGAIVQVSHDWENLTSSVTYRSQGTIPDFLVAQSISAIADFIAVRENSRLAVPKYGVISEIVDEIIMVNIGNSTVHCTTKLKNLGVGDNVLVSFPAGNKLKGQVIARL